MLREIKETVGFLSSLMKKAPEIGMITGTGLGTLTEKISIDFRVPFEKIPNFPTSTVEGHQGNLVGGRIAGKYVLALEGRFMRVIHQRRYHFPSGSWPCWGQNTCLCRVPQAV